jgi:hypothetical protein
MSKGQVLSDPQSYSLNLQQPEQDRFNLHSLTLYLCDNLIDLFPVSAYLGGGEGEILCRPCFPAIYSRGVGLGVWLVVSSFVPCSC